MNALTSTTIGDLYATACGQFTAVGFESPEIEARALLTGLLRCSVTTLIVSKDEMVDDETATEFGRWVARRLNREPAAYIIGLKNFMGFDLQVNSQVLIPRPETELLVEDVLMEIRDRDLQRPRILDVGTGSGCIAIALAAFVTDAQVLALDISQNALDLASRNADQHAVSIEFRKSDLLRDLHPEKVGGFDIIVSNPPYVASADLVTLQPELSFEPRHALDGGLDGLDLVRRLISDSLAFLKPNGLLVMEIGHNQGSRVRDLLADAKFQEICVLKDYDGHDRIVKGRKIGSI